MALILHLDQDDALRSLIGKGLKEKWHRYQGASGIVQLLNFVQKEGDNVGLVIVGNHSGGQKASAAIPVVLSTYETLRRIDPIKYTRRPPIVLCSDDEEGELERLARSCKADGYVNRGFLGGSSESARLLCYQIEDYLSRNASRKRV